MADFTVLEDSEIKRLLDIAFAASHRGKVFEARKIFEGVLAQNPEHSSAHIGIALNHIMLDEFEEGEKILIEKVLSKNEKDSEARAILSLSYMLSDKIDEAKKEAELAVKFDSNAQLAKQILEDLQA